MNLNSSEIRRLSIESFSIDVVFGVVAVAAEIPFCYTWAASVYVRFRPSVCSVAICLGVCVLCTRLSKHFSAVHSVVIVCAGDIRL